jgi:hypothetical protein
MFFNGQNPLEAMWNNTLWWVYHAADMNTPYQLALSVIISHVLYLNPLSGGSDEVIFPHRYIS